MEKRIQPYPPQPVILNLSTWKGSLIVDCLCVCKQSAFTPSQMPLYMLYNFDICWGWAWDQPGLNDLQKGLSKLWMEPKIGTLRWFLSQKRKNAGWFSFEIFSMKRRLVNHRAFIIEQSKDEIIGIWKELAQNVNASLHYCFNMTPLWYCEELRFDLISAYRPRFDQLPILLQPSASCVQIVALSSAKCHCFFFMRLILKVDEVLSDFWLKASVEWDHHKPPSFWALSNI